MDIMIIVYAVLAYLIGSIPSGLIIGKTFFNTDVRQYGSKNIGATNTYRVIGLKAALPVFLCDALKGAAGVVLLSSYGPMYMILGGILAMMGHNWSIFLGFKGGRGVATGLGVLIALSPFSQVGKYGAIKTHIIVKAIPTINVKNRACCPTRFTFSSLFAPTA